MTSWWGRSCSTRCPGASSISCGEPIRLARFPTTGHGLGKRYFPPVGGFRFGFFTVAPDTDAVAPADLDPMAALVQIQRRLPGMADHFEAAAPGMHTTATIDYGVVLSGKAVLELDDGASITLNAGDTYIQNGTRHRWSNPGDVPAVIAVTFIGANHKKVG